MSTINFDFNAVYDCAERVRDMAEIIEQEAKKVTSIITTVQSGWTGSGSEAYINYLEAVRVNIFERSQKLYSIAEALKGSAIAAEEADREAARKLAETSVSAQSVSQTQQPAACPPQTPVCEPNNKAQALPKEEIAATVNNMFSNVFDTVNNAAKKGKKR